MADIAALFDDVLFPVELKNPRAGDPVGITMWIAPIEAETDTDAWARTSVNLAMLKNDAKSFTDIPTDDVAEIERKTIIKRVSNAVRKWDWGGNSFGSIGKNPELTDENKRAIFGDIRASWIVDQVFTELSKAENFTQKPEKV